MIKDSIILDRNVAKTAHLPKKRISLQDFTPVGIFLQDFTPVIFIYLLYPIVPQNMKKTLRKDPEM